MKKKIFSILTYIAIISFVFIPKSFSQVPASTNFKVINYTFGSGGTENSTSTNFKASGVSGEVEYGSLSSTNFKSGNGLTFLMKANVPPAPTLTNPATNYDRLKFMINTGGKATDATYAIAISSDNFATDTRYIKSDNTVGATLALSDFRTYTAWGGASGAFVTGLNNNTTYYIKVKTRQGNFTESEWGAPTSGVATSDPSLSFGLDSSTITFTNLNAGNSYTDSAKSTILTTSTNAYNGYIVYGKITNPLTSGASTIANYSSSNSTPTTWSGTGFGYTTSDTNLVTGGSANRFSGSKYAGFVTSGNGDPVADHTAVIQDPSVINEQFTVSYRITGDATTAAGNYTTTIQYIIVPSY